MSFRAPRAPRLAPSTPQRRRWVPAGEVVKAPCGLKKRGFVLRPQVDIRAGGKVYVQRRPHMVVRSRVPGPVDNTPPSTQARNIHKRLLKWERWSELVPALIPIYMDLLQRSKNLLFISRDTQRRCTCVGRRSLQVTVYGFKGMSPHFVRIYSAWPY